MCFRLKHVDTQFCALKSQEISIVGGLFFRIALWLPPFILTIPSGRSLGSCGVNDVSEGVEWAVMATSLLGYRWDSTQKYNKTWGLS